MRIRRATIERDRLADQVGRHVVSAGLDRQDTEIVQGAEVIRIRRQDIPVMGLRLGQGAGLMAAYGCGERLRRLATAMFARRATFGSIHRPRLMGKTYGARLIARPGVRTLGS